MAEVRTIAVTDEISHVRLVGRLDIDGVGMVEIPLTAATVARKRPAIVDMSGVEFLGSMGIGLLVRCAVSLQRSGARVVLFGCQPLVQKSLEITKINAVLPIVDSEAAAIELVVLK
jgi:anti-sigma B factor antagonist